MNKLIKTGNVVIVQLEDGRTFNKVGINNNDFIGLSDNLNDTEYILRFFNPEYDKDMKKLNEYNKFRDTIDNIPFLFFNKEGDSVYWPDISPLSLPQDFAIAVIDAYQTGDEKALHAYKNFWILLSLNPEEKCRKKLWWFLNLHNLKISSSGFFVTYRNADRTDKKDEEGNPIYTDHHSHTTSISIGHTVSIPREECDTDVDRECSRGLHSAGSNWLEQYYYGDTGFVCLVNPADVVSVPGNSDYGKIRSTAYIPIDYVQWTEDKKVIPYDVEQGFECKYAAQAIYEGIVSIEKNRYTIKAPEVNSIVDSTIITDNLLNLAKECILNKEYSVIND